MKSTTHRFSSLLPYVTKEKNSYGPNLLMQPMVEHLLTEKQTTQVSCATEKVLNSPHTWRESLEQTPLQTSEKVYCRFLTSSSNSKPLVSSQTQWRQMHRKYGKLYVINSPKTPFLWRRGPRAFYPLYSYHCIVGMQDFFATSQIIQPKKKQLLEKVTPTWKWNV